MSRVPWWGLSAVAAIGLLPAAAIAGGPSVDVWTDRGADAVYQPGETIELRARCTVDAHLLVYEIDAEGYVHVLFPYRGNASFVEGGRTLSIPSPDASEQLVVHGPVGQGYIVALASRETMRDLPWYLRPYDAQGAGVGYVGAPDEEQGITAEGRIVGDPFVAMERIRRRVLADPEDRDGFGTAYTSYYVHQEVRYPRYVCYDCHRPSHWAWWDGFDPYYSTCSAVDLRVNWGWAWGWPYWYGCVPHYVYVMRRDCPSFCRPYSGYCYSSWDGWGRWNTLWGAHLRRYKSPPPPGYVPPGRRWKDGHGTPPGYLTVGGSATRAGERRMPVGPDPELKVMPRTDWRVGGELRKPQAVRTPIELPRGEDAAPGRTVERPRAWMRREPEARDPERRTWEQRPRVAGRLERDPELDRPAGRDEEAPPVTARRMASPGSRWDPPRRHEGSWYRETPGSGRSSGGGEPPVTVRREDRPAERGGAPRYERPGGAPRGSSGSAPARAPRAPGGGRAGGGDGRGPR